MQQFRFRQGTSRFVERIEKLPGLGEGEWFRNRASFQGFERGFSRVFLAGLAFDFCVRYSAEDARREGFTVFVVEDACRGIDVDGSVALTRTSLTALGIACISALAAA